MQLGIFAKTFTRSSVEEVFNAVKGHQLDTVQFNMACAGLPTLPDNISPTLTKRIYDGAKSSGVSIAAMSGTYNMIHPDLNARQAGLHRLRILAAACKSMGTSVITLCTGTRDPQNMWRWHPENASPAAWSDLLTSMEAALLIAEQEQVTLAIEPEQANVVDTAAKARTLLDTMRSTWLKVVIDPANLIIPDDAQPMSRVLTEAFDLLGESIVLAHAKDRGLDGSFQAAGEGMLDYDLYLRLLRSINFQGPLILHGLNEGQVDTALRFLREKLRQ